MTRQVRNAIRCQHCGAETICISCGEKVTAATPFSDWLRALRPPLDSSQVSLQNLDYIWHFYRVGWFITIEEKRYGGQPGFAQQDTHSIVRQMLETASGSEVLTTRGQVRKIEYRGHYQLTFEKTTPDDSAWMRLNGTPITVDDLLRLLTTGKGNTGGEKSA